MSIEMFNNKDSIIQSPEDRFDKLVKGRFDVVEKMMGEEKGLEFNPELDGVDSVSIVMNSESTIMSTVIYYENEKGAENHTTVTLSKDGLMSANPSALKRIGDFNREDLYNSVLDFLAEAGVGMWYTIEGEILPQGKKDEKKEKITSHRETEHEAPDWSCIPLLAKEQGLLFRVQGSAGINGTSIFIYKNLAVLEHPIRENAMYVIDIDPPIEIDLDQEGNISDSDKERILSMDWFRQYIGTVKNGTIDSSVKRAELKNLSQSDENVSRLVHSSEKNQDEWNKQTMSVIEDKLSKASEEA